MTRNKAARNDELTIYGQVAIRLNRKAVEKAVADSGRSFDEWIRTIRFTALKGEVDTNLDDTFTVTFDDWHPADVDSGADWLYHTALSYLGDVPDQVWEDLLSDDQRSTDAEITAHMNAARWPAKGLIKRLEAAGYVLDRHPRRVEGKAIGMLEEAYRMRYYMGLEFSKLIKDEESAPVEIDLGPDGPGAASADEEEEKKKRAQKKTKTHDFSF